LRYVVTSRAKQKIKHWLIDEQRERSISLGREILEKEFRKNGLNFQKMTNSLQMKEAVEVLKAKDFEDLLSKIANAHFTPTQIIEFFIPGQTVKPEETIPEEIVKKKEKKGGHDKSGVLVRGEHDLMINYAKCCNPVPGDKIIGFISRGRGVIVHTTECQNVLDLPPERFLDVSWDISKRGLFHSKIIILCANRKGLLAKITQAISNEDANISGATIASNGDTARCDFHLEVIDLDHLKRVMKAIENQKDVIKVERIS
jgi:GTP pyrophosphokinase